MVKHIRACGNDDFQNLRVAADKIRGENFNGRARRSFADGPDGLGKMFGPAIFDIIAINRCNHDVVQTQLSNRICHPARFEHVKRLWRLAGGDVAERTGTGANFAHDHHCRVTL